MPNPNVFPLGHNNAPIILVGGFGVWGREEALSFKYRGGLEDIQADLSKHGYETHSAAVGPFPAIGTVQANSMPLSRARALIELASRWLSKATLILMIGFGLIPIYG